MLPLSTSKELTLLPIPVPPPPIEASKLSNLVFWDKSVIAIDELKSPIEELTEELNEVNWASVAKVASNEELKVSNESNLVFKEAETVLNPSPLAPWGPAAITFTILVPDVASVTTTEFASLFMITLLLAIIKF